MPCICCNGNLWKSVERMSSAPICSWCRRYVVVPFLLQKHPSLIKELRGIGKFAEYGSNNGGRTLYHEGRYYFDDDRRNVPPRKER